MSDSLLQAEPDKHLLRRVQAETKSRNTVMNPTGLLLFSLLVFFLCSDVIFGAEQSQIDCSIYASNICPFRYRPLCGSDGRTYFNPCIFWNRVMRRHGSLVLRHKGKC
ncbi:serine protease inhibitor Kazal-type 6-like [Hemicordylus capensis]|uniref:serine protease inhibitor Kazal-type 6-like n=1 Tax=Hemicordylus capensis TaxID=884348 RepID=UPI002303DC97|nr:serine protease inhibitor Kazal-type 6-like [Hemicordylus capensis]